MFAFHVEHVVSIKAPAAAVFEYLDDHRRLSSHMGKSSWMMAGARMEIELDEKAGRQVGARIILKGRVIGISLFVEEKVVERTPPLRKMWQTTGSPRLLVIGNYRMGYELIPNNQASDLHMFIDYDLPSSGLEKWLGKAFGRLYAEWCTKSMAGDVARHFNSQTSNRHS